MFYETGIRSGHDFMSEVGAFVAFNVNTFEDNIFLNPVVHCESSIEPWYRIRTFLLLSQPSSEKYRTSTNVFLLSTPLIKIYFILFPRKKKC